jgi:gliding motility-associated-like protein
VIPTSQTTMPFAVNSSGDCYNFLMMGTYYQTTGCNTCTPQASGTITLASLATGSCAPNSGSVTTNPTGGAGPYSYIWMPGNYTTQTVNGLPPGSYTVTVTDASGCGVASDTVVVPVGTPPNAQFSLTPSPVAAYPGQLCMTDQTVGGATWNWVINGVPSATTSSFCYTIPDTSGICVTLFVQDANGCPDTATSCVTVLGEALISIPNVFTPNGDGINEFLKFRFLEVFNGNNLTIFNRWGKKIFEQDNYKNDWNGSGFNDGTYFFILSVPEATPNVYKGYIQLIR